MKKMRRKGIGREDVKGFIRDALITLLIAGLFLIFSLIADIRMSHKAEREFLTIEANAEVISEADVQKKMKNLESDTAEAMQEILQQTTQEMPEEVEQQPAVVETEPEIEADTEAEAEAEAEIEEEGYWEDMGEFLITAYCGCEECNGIWYGQPTFSGAPMVEGRTIAVDPSVIPIGSTVMIDGETFVAEDTGSAIIGAHIDMYFDSHEVTNEWGEQYKEVYLYIE